MAKSGWRYNLQVLKTVLWEALVRVVFLGWLALVASVVIIPALILAAILIVADILVEIVTLVLPGVKHRNLIDTFGQTDGVPGWTFRWFAWIHVNFRRAFFGHTGAFNWTPPILP